jgi:proline racemase
LKVTFDDQVNVEGLSKPVSVDCAFGGMWYAIVDADLLAIDIEASKGGEIAKLGEKIKVTFFQLIFL